MSQSKPGYSASIPCPECATIFSQTIESRRAGERFRRRRICEHGHRFTTYEANQVSRAEPLLDWQPIDNRKALKRQIAQRCAAFADTIYASRK